MEKQIAKLSGHYIVCGAGRAGGVISAELTRTQRPFVLVERQPEVVQKVRERLGGGEILHVIGDATEDAVLKSAGVERAAGVFATLSTDQDNAFVTLSAKGLNPGLRVVCCQKELGVREKLFRSGADNVVNPEYIGGLRMASEMLRPATVGFLDAMMRESEAVERFEEIAVPEGSPYVGKPVGEVKGGAGGGPLLVAVLDGQTKKYDINPDSIRSIKAGDRLVMVGEIGRLAELRRSFGAGA
jgi:voltage-gated potassium channel